MSTRTRRELLQDQAKRIRLIRAQATEVPRRVRGKIRGRVKRRFGLNRRMIGAIGAGHLKAFVHSEVDLAATEYTNAVDAALELERFRRLG